MSEENPIRLVDYLLTTTEVNTAAHVRSNYMLQILTDAMAIAADIPIRILDISRLQKLPDIIYGMKDDPHLQEIYARDNPEKLLQQTISENLQSDQFRQFSRSLTEQANKLFEHISTTIDAEINKVRQGDKLPTSDDLNNIESRLHKTIEQLADHPDNPALKEIRNNPILEPMLFLLPFIEPLIWRTKNSNAPIYHELGRMEPLWLLLVLCWFYEIREQLNQAPEPHQEKFSPIIDKAIGLPHWAIHYFSIQPHKHFICVTPPFFKAGYAHNQYVFYVQEGIYFKYCFMAYLSLLARDATDRPEAEELVAALLRRSNIENSHRERHIKTIQTAWHSLSSITFQDEKHMIDLANRDISLLGHWVVFLANHYSLFKKIIENCQNRNSFFQLALKTELASQANHKAKGIYAQIDASGIKLSIGDSPQALKLESLQFSVELSLLEEEIWFQGSPEIKDRLEKHDLTYKFSEALSRSRMQRLALQSWRIELLSDWLQRHFSARTTSNTSEATQLLGDSGQYACRLLRELTRADVGASLYQKNYGHELCLLRIVADDSDDPAVMASLEKRQETMDIIRTENKEQASEHSYCYQSISENRFLYEPAMGITIPHAVTPADFPNS